MLSLGQGNVPLFRDVAGCLEAMVVVLGEEEGKERGGGGGRGGWRTVLVTV